MVSKIYFPLLILWLFGNNAKKIIKLLKALPITVIGSFLSQIEFNTTTIIMIRWGIAGEPSI